MAASAVPGRGERPGCRPGLRCLTPCRSGVEPVVEPAVPWSTQGVTKPPGDASRLTVEPLHARARPEDQLSQLFASGWPAFITADRVVAAHIGRVRDLFGDLELVALDGDDVAVGAVWGVPIRWTGDPGQLPAGYTGALVQSVRDHDRGDAADTLVVMAAQVHPDRRGLGTAGVLLTAMCDLAAARGLDRVVVPLRPTLKVRYPLTPIEAFARWTRPDGSPLDPWVRGHWKLGARIIATTDHSQTMTGTVRQWETWTGMVLPDSGTYVIPDALSTLSVDRDREEGILVEPGIWVRHR